MMDLKSEVVDKYPLCSDVWGSGDDIKLLIESPSDYEKIIPFYNGWKSEHYVTCLFLSSDDGKIRISVLNGTGNFNYSNMADYAFIHGWKVRMMNMVLKLWRIAYFVSKKNPTFI